MITPQKHLNLEVSVVRMAAFLLKQLDRYNIMTMNEVTKSAKKLAGEDGAIILPSVLSFLYLLGKVEYHQQTDCIEFLRHGKQG